MKLLYFDCTKGATGFSFVSSLVELTGNSAELMNELKKFPFNENLAIEDFSHYNDIIDLTIYEHSIQFLSQYFTLQSMEAMNADEYEDFFKPLPILFLKEKIEKSTVTRIVKNHVKQVLDQLELADRNVNHTIKDTFALNRFSINLILMACLAIEKLEDIRVTASEVFVGYGFRTIQEGFYSFPSDETVELLLQKIPLYGRETSYECITPLGAGLLRCLTQEFDSIPCGVIKKIGYGRQKTSKTQEISLKAILFDTTSFSAEEEVIVRIECQMDDITSETLANTTEYLLKIKGVLDVFVTPIVMKKSRTGFLLSVLVIPPMKEYVENILFYHTSTFGMCEQRIKRKILERRFQQITFRDSTIRLKIGSLHGADIKAIPEYDDVKKVADHYQLPFMTVYNFSLLEGQKLIEKEEVSE